jgi:hypothetical protein
MARLIAAIAGISINLGNGMNIINQADQKAKGLVDNLGSTFNSI